MEVSRGKRWFGIVKYSSKKKGSRKSNTPAMCDERLLWMSVFLSSPSQEGWGVLRRRMGKRRFVWINMFFYERCEKLGQWWHCWCPWAQQATNTGHTHTQIEVQVWTNTHLHTKRFLHPWGAPLSKCFQTVLCQISIHYSQNLYKKAAFA